jgi:eukaryotic-like serine/threonine-protein kinase
MPDIKADLKIGHKIGAGVFGEVFLGADPVHGDVAVKVFRRDHPKPETDDEWKERKAALLNEGRRLKAADHRNVVRVHHLTEEDGGNAVHLTMHYCTGGSLQTTFEKGPIGLADARKVWTDATFGLQAVHARSMLHRDIKPSNLLVEGEVVLLGDFGFATDELVLGYAAEAGYRDHLAVEVWKGGGTSKKTDIWALGMTVYRLLHGAEWYSRSVRPQYIIADGGFAESLSWLPHVPKRWRTMIRKMMADDSRQRFQNADQVLAALGKLDIGINWECSVEPRCVTWNANKGERLISVVWENHSAFKYSWRAQSHPTGGKGRTRQLGSSNGQSSYAATERELKTFFRSR